MAEFDHRHIKRDMFLILGPGVTGERETNPKLDDEVADYIIKVLADEEGNGKHEITKKHLSRIYELIESCRDQIKLGENVKRSAEVLLPPLTRLAAKLVDLPDAPAGPITVAPDGSAKLPDINVNKLDVRELLRDHKDDEK